MSVEVEALLSRHDDPIHAECPPGFDYVFARKRAASFASDLQTRLGVTPIVRLETRVEDASFHSELSFEGVYGLLRFSAFGDMVALTPDHEVPDAISRGLEELAASHGYTFVPTAILETPYTGKHPGVTGIATWWIRYFDYL